MRCMLLICLVASVVIPSGCSSAQLQQVQSSIATVSADVLATVDAACAEYLPIAAAATKAGNDTVEAYLKYGNSVCGATNGPSSSGVAVDASTAGWVGAITGALGVLAASAPAKA